MTEFITAYGPKQRPQLICEDESLTDQSQCQLCDIETILRQFDKTGLITHVNNMTASYGDFTTVNEYQESLNQVMRAQEGFMLLPAKVRNMFANDPGLFLEFATNPANQDAMVELGLATYLPGQEPKPPKQDAEVDDKTSASTSALKDGLRSLLGDPQSAKGEA